MVITVGSHIITTEREREKEREKNVHNKRSQTHPIYAPHYDKA